MRYKATHITRYSYEAPVSQCLSELRVTPRTLPGQRLLETGIRIEPPAVLLSRKDYFGNEVTTSAVFEMHDRFLATSTSLVEVEAQPREAVSSIEWETVRDLLAAQPDEESLAACEFVFASPFIPVFEELAAYARPTFAPRRPLVDALMELSHRIHAEFLYQPKSTTIETPLAEVLRKRRGVCQDFAHVMIGALRSLRLAARYVSGYLRSGANYQGAEASHAWVAAYVPEVGWLSFDPTNDVMPSTGHVTLAWGRDYGDVTPVKGITLGGGGHSVEVEVRVEPVAIGTPVSGGGGF